MHFLFLSTWISYSTISNYYKIHVIETTGCVGDTGVCNGSILQSLKNSRGLNVWSTTISDNGLIGVHGKWGQYSANFHTAYTTLYQRPALSHISVLDKYQKRVLIAEEFPYFTSSTILYICYSISRGQ